MPHADTSLVPDSIKTKPEFWAHVYDQLDVLMAGQRHWVSLESVLYCSPAQFNNLIHAGLESVQCRFSYVQLLASLSQQIWGWRSFSQLVW